MMEYMGYMAKVEFDSDEGVFHGEVLHLRDVVTFEGTSVAELRSAFEESIDDYLEYCKKKNVAPEKPFSGNLILRITPTLHRDVAVAAARCGVSINRWVAESLEKCTKASISTNLPVQDPEDEYAVSFDMSRVEDALANIWRLHKPVKTNATTVVLSVAGGPLIVPQEVISGQEKVSLRKYSSTSRRYVSIGKGSSDVS